MTNREVVYPVYKTARFPSDMTTPPKAGIPIIVSDITAENGALTLLNVFADTPRLAIAELRLGTPKDYTVLYRAGDDIPLCDKETESRIHYT